MKFSGPSQTESVLMAENQIILLWMLNQFANIKMRNDSIKDLDNA